MKCLKCEYPLWDLQPGRCPECGEDFDPARHRFKPGAVRFCCPHCDQAYYGHGEDGHLRPSNFDCVRCGVGIDEQECVVRPREDGTYEDVIIPDQFPWHDQKRSRWSRFWSTVGMSLGKPASLGRGLPMDFRVRSGIRFLAEVYLLVILLGSASVPVLLMIIALGGGGGLSAPEILLSAGLILAAVPFTLLVILAYGSVIHGILRLTGSTKGGMGRTISGLAFGMGPMVLGSVPCAGPWCLQGPASIWAIVSSILVIIGAQGVSGIRATTAVITPLLILVAIYVGMMVVVVTGAINTATATMNTLTNSANALPFEITIGPRTTFTIDPGIVLPVINERQDLPTLEDLVAVSQFPGFTKASFEQHPATRFEGAGFEGWWMTGCLVVKGSDGAAIAKCMTKAGGEARSRACSMNSLGEFRTRSHGASSGSGPAPDTVLTPAAGDESAGSILELIRGTIDAVGGRGEDLDPSVIDLWIEKTRSAG